MAEKRNACRVPVRKPEGIRPFERPGRRWEDNIKMRLNVIGQEDVVWVHLAWDRGTWEAVSSALMNLRVP
jgi:hypothetical protein